jgi:hypothetical protein
MVLDERQPPPDGQLLEQLDDDLPKALEPMARENVLP